jgi:glucosylglycerate synthase
MAELEALQESKQESPEVAQTDLLMAVPAPLRSELFAPAIQKLLQACKLLSSPCQVVLALPGENTQDAPTELPETGAEPASERPLRYVNYPVPAIVPGIIPWLPNADTYREMARLATTLEARACTILGTDSGFNRDSLTPEKLTLLLDPGIGGCFDLVMPLYASQAFDDLVNKSILYPLTRSLYGHRVQNPLGTEFQMSSKMFPVIAANTARDSSQQQGRLPWIATLAASRNLKICQAQLGARRPSSADGIELSDALAQLTGPMFLDMEDNAAFWQRIRGSHDAPIFGVASTSTEATDTVDVRHMVEAFQLGERNLRDFWALILPPVTLLELKKLSRLSPDEFHMPDTLWARIVYDFALAHRLRNIHRTHLFGALTPLYLGWVASYAVEINQSGIATAQQRIEQLARTYESEKPYLLSRWRWPDRFHP